MEKSINNDFADEKAFLGYCDYNATAPLAASVEAWLKEGLYTFANPASLHRSGRQSRKLINSVSDYLLDLHGLKNTHEIFFHSGATEGINTILKGLSQEKRPYYYFVTDHACVSAVIHSLVKEKNCLAFPLKVETSGDFNLTQIINEMKKSQTAILNYTYVHNESGVVWPFDLALEIKEKTGCFIHVDAVQAPGKISQFFKLAPELDAYSFSGHKFGSLKGVGYCLIKKKLLIAPLILGGGQQQGRRSGTENPMGVYSLKLAMEELVHKFDYENLLKAKNHIETNLCGLLGDEAILVGNKAKVRNANTIMLGFKNLKTDVLHAALDLAGIEVSTGSACSSGPDHSDRVLSNMGLSSEYPGGPIRFSFSPFVTMKEATKISEIILKVFSRFLAK